MNGSVKKETKTRPHLQSNTRPQPCRSSFWLVNFECWQNDGDHFELSSNAWNAADNAGLHSVCNIV